MPPHDDSAADTRHPVRVVVATIAAFASGIGVALQSRINGQLGAELGDGFVAAFLSFGSGFVILAIAVLFVPDARRGLGRVLGAVRERRIPWWHLMGGAAGALFVLTGSLVIGVIGVALFTVGVVAGQMTSSVLIDRNGFGSTAPKPLSPTRVIGALLALAGVALAVSGQLRVDVPWWLLLVPLVVGLGIGFQQAANGQVRVVADSALAATFVNFIVGATLLTIALLVHLLFAPWPAEFPASPLLYLGGVVGVVFIGTQVLVVRVIGVLVLGLAILSGQLAAAVLFDLVLPLAGHTFAASSAIGAAVTLLAVVLAVIPSRRR
ncbi:MAG: DMT family transporter [Pseudolysinimonas sp.]